jgi:RimJ/RimL family protein N-acetyltransferase
VINEAPELVTPRLVLRGHRAGDLADCLAMWRDPEVVRFIGGRPSSEEDAWARILRYLGHWRACGYGFWIVHDRAGGFVGEVGVADFKRAIAPEHACAHEAGWVIATAAAGRGLATEAMTAALAWCDGVLGAPRVTAVIEADNASSIRVAQKCGFHRAGSTTYKGDAVDIYVRPGDRQVE